MTATSCTSCSMYKIREATDSDHTEILRVWEEAVRDTHGFLNDGEIEFYKKLIPVYLKEVELRVSEQDGRINGFSGISGMKLEMLFVAQREKGIGSQLLADAITRGVNAVDVNEENTQAAGFYLAKGFRQSGRSETDGEGRPHPILHLTLARETDVPGQRQ